jgi:hypothetical protein
MPTLRLPDKTGIGISSRGSSARQVSFGRVGLGLPAHDGSSRHTCGKEYGTGAPSGGTWLVQDAQAPVGPPLLEADLQRPPVLVSP